MHVQGSANDIHSFSFRDFFHNSARGPLRQYAAQKLGYRMQPREDPINPFHSTLGLDIYTGGWLKRWGCCWAQPPRPLLAVFLRGGAALGRTASGWGCLIKSNLQMVIRKERLTSKRKSNNVRNSIKLVKNRVPINGIGTCNAIWKCGFCTCGICENHKLRLAKLSLVGAPRNEPRNERAVGLPRARARSFTKVTRGGEWGGTTLFLWQQGTTHNQYYI